MSFDALSGYVQRAGSYVPAVSKDQVIKNVGTYAVPAITIAATSMINGAEAVTFVDCMNKCNENPDVSPLAVLVCQTLCAIFAKG
ncbi:MAG: hypothetical protein SNF33_07285 [Candidatus Algichlamydia australiensis]|nr:hypothetical protein [Chlamydiales bacterium]